MSEDSEKIPFWEHFVELRRRLLVAVIALAAGSIVSFSLAETVINYLAQPIGGIDKLQAIEVTETISVFMRVSLLCGFILAMPIILYEVLAFIVPGLTKSERRWVYAAIPSATILFLAGAAFTYYFMFPAAIPFLVGFMNVTTIPRLSDYIKFVTNMLFWIGISFQMPLIIFVLAKVRIVNASMLAKQWRIAVVVIAIVAAVVSPTVDPINMGLLMLPLMALYVLSVLLAAFANPKKKE
jgi:sec-independent protein translocase protein TatC